MKKTALIIWISCALMITVGSLMPHLGWPPEAFHIDKFIHGSAYAGLAFLPFFFTTNRNVIIIFLAAIIAMGGGIEILQTFMPSRDGTIGDFAADVCGVIAGALIAIRMRPLIIKWFKK